MRGARLLSCLLAGGVALAGCTAILGDFETGTVSDSQDGATADTAQPPGDDAGDASGGNDVSPPSEAGGDPLPTCAAPQVLCGTVCADRSSSPDHCGTCGHSCGGGTCTQGRCGPVLVYQGTPIGPISMDLNDVFFESNEDPSYKLLACPKT